MALAYRKRKKGCHCAGGEHPTTLSLLLNGNITLALDETMGYLHMAS